MGDTGSLFLGGAVCGMAFALDLPMVIPVVGLIYVVEVLSDIIQVVYFKRPAESAFSAWRPCTTIWRWGLERKQAVLCLFRPDPAAVRTGLLGSHVPVSHVDLRLRRTGRTERRSPMARKPKRDLTVEEQLARGPWTCPFLMLVLLLLGIGLIMMFSASYATAYYTDGDPLVYISRQALFGAVGVVGMFVVSKINYQTFRWMSMPALIGSYRPSGPGVYPIGSDPQPGPAVAGSWGSSSSPRSLPRLRSSSFLPPG